MHLPYTSVTSLFLNIWRVKVLSTEEESDAYKENESVLILDMFSIKAGRFQEPILSGWSSDTQAREGNQEVEFSWGLKHVHQQQQRLHVRM